MNTNQTYKYHIGKAIYEEFIKSGLSSSQLAEMLNYSTNEVYNLFKSHYLGIKRLIEVTKALKHNFLFDIALMVEDEAFAQEATFNLSSEDMVTLPSNQLNEVGIEEYSSILDEYLVTDHQQPLLVITDKNDVADDLLYKKSFELYGNRGYKMMTDTRHIELKPYMVPVFTEINESLCHKDLDTQIGEVVAAKRTSDRHIVFILNLQSVSEESLLEDVNLVYDLWHHSTHIVFLHSS